MRLQSSFSILICLSVAPAVTLKIYPAITYHDSCGIPFRTDFEDTLTQVFYKAKSAVETIEAGGIFNVPKDVDEKDKDEKAKHERDRYLSHVLGTIMPVSRDGYPTIRLIATSLKQFEKLQKSPTESLGEGLTNTLSRTLEFRCGMRDMHHKRHFRPNVEDEFSLEYPYEGFHGMSMSHTFKAPANKQVLSCYRGFDEDTLDFAYGFTIPSTKENVPSIIILCDRYVHYLTKGFYKPPPERGIKKVLGFFKSDKSSQERSDPKKYEPDADIDKEMLSFDNFLLRAMSLTSVVGFTGYVPARDGYHEEATFFPRQDSLNRSSYQEAVNKKDPLRSHTVALTAALMYLSRTDLPIKRLYLHEGGKLLGEMPDISKSVEGEWPSESR